MLPTAAGSRLGWLHWGAIDRLGGLLCSCLHVSAVPRLCKVAYFGYRFNNQVFGFALKNRAKQQPLAATLHYLSSTATSSKHTAAFTAHLMPVTLFSLTDPRADEFWSEPNELAVGLFWIRRRGECQLHGLFPFSASVGFAHSSDAPACMLSVSLARPAWPGHFHK